MIIWPQDLRPEKISGEDFIALTELIENGKATRK